jgi:hypothetical protein
VNLLRNAFYPGFEASFQIRITRIEEHVHHVEKEAGTAYMEATNDNFAAVQEMCRHILERANATQLLSRCHRMIPHCRNESFFGREELLEDIHSYLSPLHMPRRQRLFALSGFVGCGKTQIALEYTYRHLKDYGIILWISASSAEKVEKSFVEAAALMGIRDSAMHANEVRNFVLQRLAITGTSRRHDGSFSTKRILP